MRRMMLSSPMSHSAIVREGAGSAKGRTRREGRRMADAGEESGVLLTRRREMR